MIRIALLAFAVALSLPAAEIDDKLLEASRKGDLAAVKELVERGALLETTTPYGQTPLYLAAMNGREEVVRFLLDKGANVDVRDTFYKEPILSFVLGRKHYGVARLLLSKGTASADGTLPVVAGAGNAELLQFFLEKYKPSQGALDKAYEMALNQKRTETAAALKKAGARDPAPPFNVDPEVLESYTGTYRADGFPLDIKAFAKEGKLYMQATGQSEFPLKAKSATQFEFLPAGIDVAFDSVDSFIFKQGTRNLKFKKVVTQ